MMVLFICDGIQCTSSFFFIFSRQIGGSIDSEEILRERARLICLNVISKAVYQVSKENLDNVQNIVKIPVTETLQTNVKANISETFETVTGTPAQQKVNFFQ